MTYQGYLVDANGTALATNAPKNYDVVFRIHDSSSGTGIALWTEQQTVTVDKGYFSVLLGEGASIGEARPNLSTLFTNATASERWVSLTVKKIGPAQSDVSILPRLRLLTSPYSFLATTAVNAVNAVNVTGSGTIQASNLGANAVDSSKILDATIVNADVSASAAIADTKLATIATAGKVADTALSANVALRGSPNTFSGNQIFTGNVGIGATTPPANRLVVTANVAPTLSIEPSVLIKLDNDSQISPAVAGIGFGRTGLTRQAIVGGTFGNDFLDFYTGGVLSVPKMRIDAAGNVGIGTVTPTRGKLEIAGNAPANHNTGFGYLNPDRFTFLNKNGPGRSLDNATGILFLEGANSADKTNISGGGPYYGGVSLFCEDMAKAIAFIAFSDERIKHIQGRSDAACDLSTLQRIEVTDYTYIDTLTKGAGQHKKLIAQQVEKIYPQAVNQATDVVPDIYKKATQKDGWVELATDLKKGERVRLLSEKTEGIHEVLEVTKDKFRTDFKPEGGQVFVYGREVKDFRSVDYEAISMLNVSATQELARKVKAQESELTELRAELAKLRSERKTLAHSVSALQARDEAREARLIKLELSLQDAPAGDKARTQARAQSPAASGQLTSLNQ